MSEATASPNGTIVQKPGHLEVRIDRFFPHAIGPVWQALTRSEYLAQWLAPGHIELVTGGRARLDFGDSGVAIDSTVTEIEAPNVLEYSWSGPGEPLRPLRFVLTIGVGGTRLTLTLKLPPGEDAARAAAGFDAHLEMLAATLEGVPIKFPFPLFKALRGAYQEMA
jgi:uncharacterized protein YndB with AHSA1/START domain